MKKLAFVVAAEVVGGHEFQARALIEDLSRFVEVSVFLNRQEQAIVFAGSADRIEVHPNLFLDRGHLGRQALNGIWRSIAIRRLLKDYDLIIVSAGTVNAGVCTSVALMGHGAVSLYLPCFYDRTLISRRGGRLYNALLAMFGSLYRNVITINRIQGELIRGFMHRPTFVIPNLVRDVRPARTTRQGHILYIGRLDRQKRVSELLRSLDFPENPYREVLVMGDGPERDRVAHTAASLRYVKASLTGWISPNEQDALIDGNDVLIVNSVIEGEPLVIREANRRGLLVLARDIPGIRGVTYRQNRFRSDQRLRQLLQGASLGELKKKAQQTNNEVSKARVHATKYFLSKCN